MIENTAVLTIAGSDSGGGAGIQADLKTFSALGVYGASVITAVTAQNLAGVFAVQAIDPAVVEKQLRAVLEGYPVKAVKTGMLFSRQIIEVTADVLAGCAGIPLIIDPVFAATSGGKLIDEEAVAALEKRLFPLAALITPNMPEAEILGGVKLENRRHLEKTARDLFEKFKVPVLLKGGHLTDSACDILCDHEGMHAYDSELIEGINNHGSGCTYASAIAALLARGLPLRDAVAQAKDYISRCLKNPLHLTAHTLILNHFWAST